MSPAPAKAKQRTTRRPTGLPSWPILLLAGAEKSGKSWSCAEASGSDLVGRCLWIGIGEDDPDEYGGLKDADFEIVEHDGTFRDILAAVEWAAAQPKTDEKPTLIVLDSMTRLWDLLCDMAQDTANERQSRKRNGAETSEADITVDLWNVAKDRWQRVLDALRAHQGPSLLTARLEDVTVMVNGRPTGEKQPKVKAEKGLPYDVGGIVQMPERGKAFLTGVRSTRMHVPERIPLPGFRVDKLWRDLGLADVTAGDRSHARPDRANLGPVATQRTLLLQQIKDAVAGDSDEIRRIATDWAASHDGQAISETTDIGGLELLRDDIQARAIQTTEGVPA